MSLPAHQTGVATARCGCAGVFGATEIARGLPAESLRRWFTPEGVGGRIRDEIRALASFRRLNLLEDFAHLGRFDVIFCRNVAIYSAIPIEPGSLSASLAH